MTDYDLSNMPANVRAQYERSQEIRKTLDGKPSDVPPAPADPTPPPAEDQKKPEPKPQDKPDEWQHRYQVLQGKYNAEVPKLHQEVRSLSAQLKAALEDIERMKTATEAGPQGAFKEMLGVFGEEDPQVKFAREQQERIDKLEAQLAGVTRNIDSVVETQAVTAEDRFYAALDRAMPDWQAVNVDPALMLWLGEIDPMWGTTRKEVFDDAVARLDAARVSAFFAEYKRQSAPPPAPPKPAPKPSDKLAAQVVPDNAGGNDAAAQSENTWTRAQIKQFFEDVRRGQYRGREAEADKIQRDILKANAEGRIVG